MASNPLMVYESCTVEELLTKPVGTVFVPDSLQDHRTIIFGGLDASRAGYMRCRTIPLPSEADPNGWQSYSIASLKGHCTRVSLLSYFQCLTAAKWLMEAAPAMITHLYPKAALLPVPPPDAVIPLSAKQLVRDKLKGAFSNVSCIGPDDKFDVYVESRLFTEVATVDREGMVRARLDGLDPAAYQSIKSIFTSV